MTDWVELCKGSAGWVRLIGEKNTFSLFFQRINFLLFSRLFILFTLSLFSHFRSPIFEIATYRFQEYFDGSIVSCYFELYHSSLLVSAAQQLEAKLKLSLLLSLV